MSLKIGDTFFNREGKPGVVIGRDERTEKLIVDKKGEEYQKARTYGFINGLNQTEREEFKTILDKVKENKDPTKRVADLQQVIESIQLDPKKQVLTRYLEGELSHIMYSESIHPNIYKVDEDKT